MDGLATETLSQSRPVWKGKEPRILHRFDGNRPTQSLNLFELWRRRKRSIGDSRMAAPIEVRRALSGRCRLRLRAGSYPESPGATGSAEPPRSRIKFRITSPICDLRRRIQIRFPRAAAPSSAPSTKLSIARPSLPFPGRLQVQFQNTDRRCLAVGPAQPGPSCHPRRKEPRSVGVRAISDAMFLRIDFKT